MRSSSPLLSGGSTNRIGSDDKRRIRDLEQLLDNKHIDLSTERKKLLSEFDREKRTLIN